MYDNCNYRVVQSNKLIRACKKFGDSKHPAVYNKIVSMAISRIIPTLPNGDPNKFPNQGTVTLSYKELKECFSHRFTFDEIDEIADALLRTIITHYKEHESFIKYTLFTNAEYTPEKIMNLTFHEDAKKDLIDLVNTPYTEIFLADILTLRSFYAMRIYEISVSWIHNYKRRHYFEYSLDEWKVMLNVSKGIKDTYNIYPGSLYQKVFKKPTEEINSKTHLKIRCDAIKEKNKIVAVRIVFEEDCLLVMTTKLRDNYNEKWGREFDISKQLL